MIGLIVNPIAGMGGSVGLKGTDGAETLEKARALGARPRAMDRARRTMKIVAAAAPGARVTVAEGSMGGDALEGLDLDVKAVPMTAPSGAGETTRIARIMRDENVSVLLFAGGDGTARDVAAAVGLDTPVLGIPCGVKMHSGVFAVSPEAAGRLVADLLVAGRQRVGFRKVEIMDIDENAVRAGRIAARLYGYVRAPHGQRLLQAAKGGPSLFDEAAVAQACAEVAAEMVPDTLYLVGPGTTAKRVLSALGIEDGTLLGVDAVMNGRLVGRDVTEDQALRLAGPGPLKIIVGVTGGQGFVFGRGNQPIGAEAIRRAGAEGVTVVASAEKLMALPEPLLHVDTGDPGIDSTLCGFWRIRVGPRRTMMMRLGG